MTEPIRLDDYRQEEATQPFPTENASDDHAEEAVTGLLGMNPWILWGLLVVAIAVCAPIVWMYAPAEWGFFRKALGTLFIATLAHYSLFINRILVAHW